MCRVRLKPCTRLDVPGLSAGHRRPLRGDLGSGARRSARRVRAGRSARREDRSGPAGGTSGSGSRRGGGVFCSARAFSASGVRRLSSRTTARYDRYAQMRHGVVFATVFDFESTTSQLGFQPPMISSPQGGLPARLAGRAAIAPRCSRSRTCPNDVPTHAAGPRTRSILLVFPGDSTITRGQPSAPTSVGDPSLTRSGPGKRHAIELAFRTWPALSQVRVARQVGCTRQYVGQIRAQGETTFTLPDRVVGKDGKLYSARRPASARPVSEDFGSDDSSKDSVSETVVAPASDPSVREAAASPCTSPGPVRSAGAVRFPDARRIRRRSGVRNVSARTGLSGSGVPSSTRGTLGVSGQNTYCSVWDCVLVRRPARRRWPAGWVRSRSRWEAPGGWLCSARSRIRCLYTCRVRLKPCTRQDVPGLSRGQGRSSTSWRPF